MPFWVVAVALIAFACAGFMATEYAEWLAPRVAVRMAIVPLRHRVAISARIGLALATGVVGAVYFAHGTSALGLAVVGLACLTLDTACCLDLRLGRLPLAVTAPALSLASLVTLVGGGWLPLVITAAIVLPFAIAALISHGRNIAWSDVQLIAIGALVLNPILGLMTLAATCFAASGVAIARRRTAEPIPFAPYLATTIQLALLSPGALR